MIFDIAKDRDGDSYMSLFKEAMRNASPEDMRAEVQDVCEYFESRRVSNERARDRLNNGTYTITQIVAVLVGRVQDLEAKLERAGDDRAHAEAQKLLDKHMDVMLTHGAGVAQGLAMAIIELSPYVERDGQLVRKSDGKPVTL